MTPQDGVTLSEIYRTVQRLEAALKEVQEKVAPIPTLVVRVESAEDDITDLKGDMKSIRRDTAMVSGGIGMAAFVASLWPWHR